MRISIKKLFPALLFASCSAFGDLYIGGGYTYSSVDLDGMEVFEYPNAGSPTLRTDLTQGPPLIGAGLGPSTGLGFTNFAPFDPFVELAEDRFDGWSVLLGYRIDGPWSVELNYFDGGTESTARYLAGTNMSAETSLETLSLDVLWSYQLACLSSVSLIGAAGVVSQRVKTKFQYGAVQCPGGDPSACFLSALSASNTETDTRLQLGLGATYQLTEKLSARAMVKAVPGGFDFSDGTPYSLGVSLIYEI
ncbi:outer membrane beta-barrel protein [Pseudomaricurvus alkylphenolicus]|uniref:outer membrane beta-barrel protein n=1 Tax=Pseudomaricurvus alkylphenolicus TaxID=1306991 RepID=UPI00142473E7|nr:outer membrane beta-barrel protein [Pseudomaricurvus alkylphenolicus]NIB42106.1 outer membrane beta-barrel protein [Pseudomaricurvus alkylphenolicus]